MSRLIIRVTVLMSLVVPLQTASAAPPAIEKFLVEGRLAAGAAAMNAVLEKDRQNAEAGFSLGVTQFLQAVENLGRDQYRYGLLGGRRQAMPFMRLPVPENEAPELLNYPKARAIIQGYMDGLKIAESTLAAVKPADVKLTLRIGQIRLDLDGDGVATDEESLWRVIESVSGNGRTSDAGPEVNQFVVAFDDADVLWLRGYCHVMSALGEIVLAYDWKDQFERTAHLFYPNVESPYSFLQKEGAGPFNGFNTQNILDVIALIHTINYECAEPERMKSALTHIEAVISLSRESWKLINAETDDDHEWLPNTKQTAALGGMRVSQQMQSGWQLFLDEADEIVQGKKLLPFWRGIEGGAIIFDGNVPSNPNVGINFRRIFTEPTRLDLVLWLQGTGLTPYLEKGEKTDPDSWRQMLNAFEGNFFMFMVWFN